jgi:CMP/dCMP kinase
MPSKKIIIAIDGESGSGKSTLAKSLAQVLNFEHIDTGAMYRAVTYQLIIQGIKITDLVAVDKLLKTVLIVFDHKRVFINNKEVTQEIRAQKTADLVSHVAKIPQVRKKMVELQREAGKKGNTVLEGRDIGTVVFPQADIKFFITADVNIRAERRLAELSEKECSLVEVKANLEKRDLIDSTRELSPLQKATDAIEIDSTQFTIEQTVEQALKQIRKKFPKF